MTKIHKLVDKYKPDYLFDDLFEDFDDLVKYKEIYENELRDFMYRCNKKLRMIENDPKHNGELDKYLFNNALPNKYVTKTINDIINYMDG